MMKSYTCYQLSVTNELSSLWFVSSWLRVCCPSILMWSKFNYDEHVDLYRISWKCKCNHSGNLNLERKISFLMNIIKEMNDDRDIRFCRWDILIGSYWILRIWQNSSVTWKISNEIIFWKKKKTRAIKNVFNDRLNDRQVISWGVVWMTRIWSKTIRLKRFEVTKTQINEKYEVEHIFGHVEFKIFKK